MNDLSTLSNERHTILLAEIAALLHNMGKLDPNFLAPKMSDADYAEGKVISQLLDIPKYEVKRLSAPALDMFEEHWHSIIEQDSSDLGKQLSRGIENDEHCDRKVKAALKFAAFRKANGFLYRCFSPARQKRNAACVQAWENWWEIEQTLKQLENKRELLQQKLSEKLSEDQRRKAGSDFNNITERIKNIEEKKEQAKEIFDAEKKQLGTSTIKDELKAQAKLEKAFYIPIEVSSENWNIATLLTIFWDDFFYREIADDRAHSGYTRKSALEPWLKQNLDTALPALLILSHGEISGSEKDIEIIKPEPKAPKWDHLRFATAFGYDHAEVNKLILPDARHHLIGEALKSCTDPVNERANFVLQARKNLSLGLGDTQWPINEINLWDFSSSIAALFKSGVARAILECEVPTVGQMKWRFLSIRFDGLSYLSQVNHVSDLLGRKNILEAALNKVRKEFEETYPLGNEIYRDENGSVFVVPELADPEQKILCLENENKITLKEHLEDEFARYAGEESEDAGMAFAGELVPHISEGAGMRGKDLKLGKYLSGVPRTLEADPKQMDIWWSNRQAKNKEICTVCGIRPVGYKPPEVEMPPWVNSEKAKNRNICCVCLHRRGRRAEEWLDNLQSTIWADEVLDANGRFALLVGKFDVRGWLDGTLIPTMRKPSSFARIRRCWKTTYTFWQQVKEAIIHTKIGGLRPRLEIIPRNLGELEDELGRWAHSYELQIAGETISVVWNHSGGSFLLVECLDDLARRLGLDYSESSAAELQRWLGENGNQSGWNLLEPSGYLSPAISTGVSLICENVSSSEDAYLPQIPLLTEPALFMTLIPADKAMQVVQAIKEKYEREMSKVQDRLPLHLGVVIAKRRTPLRAVLDAGRAMLDRDAEWQEWQVVESEPKSSSDAPEHIQNDAHFANWQHIHLKKGARKISMRVAKMMGDGEEPDQWHTHLLHPQSNHNGELYDDVIASLIASKSWKKPEGLKKEDKVYITPSTFDFEYLDTTARRFEIAYDERGQRLGRTTRPYYLGEIEQLQKVWKIISKHMRSTQWMHVTEIIERKRRAWQEPRGVSDKYSEIFKQFISNTLNNIKWEPKLEDEEDRALLERATLHGMLDDVIDLYHEALKEPEEA